MIYLSPQQHACVALVARGLEDREVAAELGIARGTVKVHLTHARNKCGARNRVELTLMFMRGVLRAPALRDAA